MIRRAAVALVLAASAFAMIPGSPAQARACRIDFECYTTYYSDASKTTVVGSLYESCTGTRYFDGVRTGYLTFQETRCF
ncbi:DUF6289 family protein [Micromonospora cathayae]|uniref:DUF6289 family protein n=1 Tax=Micromonospora cathayae TaxID=3028804 RepID=A0ABY7ZUT7_9ACTN|nr:DUF6289 family protein [Micromonospora sp. HUAS 3]WDZ86171.1 DUF6289 family protein [Micromonospora sp. HUAS 3]